jgi:exoribonuclease R
MLAMIIFLLQSVRHIFVPAERKVPKVRIQTRQADILSSQRIIVTIDSWPRNSRYPLVSKYKTTLTFTLHVENKLSRIL